MIAVVGLGHLAEDLAPAVSAVPVAASLDGPSPERRDRPRASGAGAPATDGPATDGPAAAAPVAPPVAPPTPTPTPTPSAGAGLDEPPATPVDGREETLRTDQATTPAAPGTAPTTVPTTVPTAPPTEPQAPPVEPQAPAATALDPRLSAPQVRLDHAGTRATVTLPTADLSPGDTVVLTATHTLGAAVPAQGGWACRVSADWFDGHLWATHTVSCTWTGAAGAAPVLVTQYGLFGPGEITGTVTAAADGDPGDNTTSAPLG